LMAKALNAKATLYQATGRRPQSVELLERALKISEDWNGPDHFDTAMIAYNLGTSLFYMNRREEAIRLLQRALVVFEAREKTGSDGRLAVAARNALAGAIEAVGDKDAALQLARRTVAEAEARLGADHPELAVPLNNLATMLTSAGRYDEAEPHARRALKIIEDRYGRDHPIAAPIINGIANIEVARRRYDQAEASSLRAVTIARNALSVEHPDTAKFMENHATILFDRGKPADALPVFDESRRIRRKLMGRTLPVLAEEHSLSVLQGDERSAIDYALTRALLMWEDPQWAETSAGWVLNAKSLTLRAFAERAVLARDARTPAAKEALRTLDETRLKLASLTFQTAPTDSEAFLARQREVEALVQRERRESTALGRALNLPDHEPWVEIQRVRQKLPPDALLIEFARYHQLAPGTDGLKPDEKNWSYAVWVIPSAGQGRVKVVDLGPAAPIEQAVANLTAKLKYDERVYLEEGEVGYEARCLPALREVARRVLDPILPELAAVKRWAISPDGALWLIPWPALPVAENVYAVERHLIHLVATGRDLVEPKPQGPGTSAPVVFADPSYDLSPTGGTTAPAQPGAAESPTSEDVNAYLTRAIDLGGTYPRLVFSEREAREVAPRMSAYAKAPTKVFQLDEATEANFKRLQRPRALLLSTHGAYREKPLNATDPAVLAMPDNPLLRCWLVLAGGNKHAEWFESNRGSGNDGLLTGLEVLGTDLRGTELVVLSACETAQGRTFEGEGVSGLRQAFHLAGARTVLGTLWSVGDLPATQMTINFFERLNLDHDPATALRGAQLAMINHHRKAGGAAHPYRWAMFAMTGDPGDGWAHDPVPEDPGGPPILTDDAKEGGPTRGGDLHTDTDHIAQATTADGEPPAGRYLFGLSGPGRPARGHPWIEGALFTAILAGSLYSARWWLRGASPGV
ncbi:MAG: CHAT domain-containing protein, partial [Isosphaeraceae bacterium]